MPMSLFVLFTTVGMSVGVDPSLLSAICYVESNHRPYVVNAPEGSLGVCQVKLRTARWLGFTGTAHELRYVPATNIRYAAMYLRYQMRRYGSTKHAVAAYNAGSVRYRGGKLINAGYVKKVYKALLRCGNER